MQTVMKGHPKGNTLNISDYVIKGEGHFRKSEFSWECKWFCVGTGLVRYGKWQELNVSRISQPWCVCVLSHFSRVCDPVDGSLPDSSAHGTLQARTLEWAAISSSRGSS